MFLYLQNNSLIGPIPTEIGNLTELTILSLSTNSLTGPIPTEIGNLTKLEELYLTNTSLIGPIPTEIGKLTQLMFLYAQNNFLHTLPLIESIPNSAFIFINNNKFGFNSIVPNLKDKDDVSRSGFSYEPQKLLDTRDTIINKLGTSIELTISDDYEGNSLSMVQRRKHYTK